MNKKITLKAARVNANLTQAEAAKRIGVTRDTLSNWEKGKSFPNALKLKSVEKVYMVSYNDIIFLPRDYT